MTNQDPSTKSPPTATPASIIQHKQASSSPVLFRRADDPVRGRHLQAAGSTSIVKGQLILAERPLLALQSLDNLAAAWTCSNCKAFVGGPDAALLKRFQKRNDVTDDDTNHLSSSSLSFSDDSHTEDDDDDNSYAIHPCLKQCGHVYCSTTCRDDAWAAHHCYLCTGDLASDHALVQFKRFACETNEILLLVAEWWVAQHVLAATSRLESLELELDACAKDTDKDDNINSIDSSNTAVDVNKYTDFLMEPWWDVVTADLLTDDQPGGFATAFGLQESLKKVCKDAADLLRRALAETSAAAATTTTTTDSDGSGNGRIIIPPITAMDVAVRIGACEQNAMGIRQRHALCRSVFDVDLRQRRHKEIIQCLAQAGFIGNDDDDGCCDDIIEDGDEPEKENETGAEEEVAVAKSEGEDEDQTKENDVIVKEGEEWDYSVEEITDYLASLFTDEDGTVMDEADPSEQMRDTQGDDLDYIFPPLDGTTLYSTLCKMNHSCDPNVIVLYKRTGWGSKHPLTAYCVARRDILAGDELTISYIDAEEPYAKRQETLQNYGFTCKCSKCERESSTKDVTASLGNEDDKKVLFGADDEDEMFGADDDEDNEALEDEQGTAEDGERRLQQRLEHLDTAANHSRFGSIPLKILAQVSSYVIQMASAVSELGDTVLSDLLEQCLTGVRERDFCLCKIVGRDLYSTLYLMLRKDSAWPNVCYREAFWYSCLVAAIGYAHECNFVTALDFLDNGFVLGLPRDDERIKDFFAYVEYHAAGMAVGPWPSAIRQMVPDYRGDRLSKLIQEKSLSQPIRFPIREVTKEVSLDDFQAECVAVSQPLVIRGFADEWPAISKWRSLQYFARNHGHRLVPIELGSMMTNNMKEDMTSFRSFIESFLVASSTKEHWSLADASDPSSRVAFLAQHPLLDQIPMLQGDLNMRPTLCGSMGPSHVYTWMGTGGTRTPLHFDSYDNLFVQVVGAKYVRLYSPSETSKLYVGSKSAYGLQGNMSEVNCEQEDWQQHPLAKEATYTEVLLLPGDCLYIPARTWHYIRSLSTSVSINFWFG
jgi:hypothetical protein